jgi:hypothetical protein
MRSPVVLDERYVYAYTVYYGIAAVWGILVARNGLFLLEETGGAGYEAVVTFLLAAVSAVLAFLTLTNAARAEKWVTIAWMMTLAAFPGAAIYQWAAAGDTSRAGTVASTLIYLVFPFARYIYLTRKTRKVTDG